MNRRLLVPLGLAVTALLVVAALAASAHPLGGGHRGSGPTPAFLDYVFTTFVIIGVAMFALFVWGFFTTMPERVRRKRPSRMRLFGLLIYLAAALAIGYALSSSRLRNGLQNANKQKRAGQEPNLHGDPRATTPNPHGRNARIRWDEVAVALAVLGAAGVAAFASSKRRRLPAPPWRTASRRSLSDALDESLDDLRAEPDLRKAIVAAYARMERALAAAGLARHPAEAPLEYVERTLAELHASADAARRLTDLFEWAKFSQHEPEPQMRDDAIDALVAVRDELRAPEQAEEPVAA